MSSASESLLDMLVDRSGVLAEAVLSLLVVRSAFSRLITGMRESTSFCRWCPDSRVLLSMSRLMEEKVRFMALRASSWLSVGSSVKVSLIA